LILSDAQREAARLEVAQAPYGQRGKVAQRLAAEFGVHPNTLFYRPRKKGTPASSNDNRGLSDLSTGSYQQIQPHDTTRASDAEEKGKAEGGQ
jgi:hypothetical protein